MSDDGAPPRPDEPVGPERSGDVPAAARPVHVMLRDRNYGPYLFGWGLTSLGMWVHNIAAAIAVFEITRSTFLVGLVSIAQFAPQMLLTMWAGSRADRADRSRQALFGWSAAALGSILAFVWVGPLGMEGIVGAAGIIVAGLSVGVGFAFGIPAMHAMMPSLVSPLELRTAVALHSVPMTIARAFGPAIGAFLLLRAGAAVAFAFSAALHLVHTFLAARIRVSTTVRPASGADRGIAVALRFVRSNPVLLVLFLGVGIVGYGSDPIVTLTPALGVELTGGTESVGVLATSWGLGSAVSFLFIRRLQDLLGLRRLSMLGLGMIGGGLLLLSAIPPLRPALAALFVGGMGMTFALTSITTQVHQRAPEQLRGRIMALWSMSYLGTRPIAAGLNGSIAEAFSLRAALLVVATCAFLAAILIGVASREAGRTDAP